MKAINGENLRCKVLSQFIYFILVLLCCSSLSAKTFVEEHDGDNTIQGLKYINDKAVEFINAYNQIHHTNWQSLGADPRTLVYKCDAPIQAKWITDVADVIAVNHEVYHIAISCNKTVSDIAETRQWVIEIPTTRPKESLN